MATVTIRLRSGRTDKNGRSVLSAIIRHRSTSTRLSLRLKVKPKDWNETSSEPRKSCPSRAQVSERIQEARLAGRQVITRLSSSRSTYTAKDVRRALERDLFGAGQSDFVAFARNEVESYYEHSKEGTAKNREVGVNRFVSFLEDTRGREEIAFGSVNLALIKEYADWLRSEGLAKKTIHNYLSALKVFVLQAAREERIERNPFSFYTMRNANATEKRRAWLRKGEIRQIANAEIDDNHELSRDLFLFAYYAWGMRFGDVLSFKKRYIRLDKLQYSMQKTGTNATLPLTPEAKQIAEAYGNVSDTYVFPLLERYDLPTEWEKAKNSRNATVNNHLVHIADAAGIDKKVTFHVARHSAASQMYLAWKDVFKVRLYLGHSSVEMTQSYLRGMEGISLDELGDWQGAL